MNRCKAWVLLTVVLCVPLPALADPAPRILFAGNSNFSARAMLTVAEVVAGEGEGEGEGESATVHVYPVGDEIYDNGSVSLSELLRVIQFFNSDGVYVCYEADPPTEDGYCPGIGP